MKTNVVDCVVAGRIARSLRTRTRAASKVRPAQTPRIDHFCTVAP